MANVYREPAPQTVSYEPALSSAPYAERRAVRRPAAPRHEDDPDAPVVIDFVATEQDLPLRSPHAALVYAAIVMGLIAVFVLGFNPPARGHRAHTAERR